MFHPWVGKIHEEGNSNPFQYCCLGNPMDGGAWWVLREPGSQGLKRAGHDWVTNQQQLVKYSFQWKTKKPNNQSPKYYQSIILKAVQKSLLEQYAVHADSDKGGAGWKSSKNGFKGKSHYWHLKDSWTSNSEIKQPQQSWGRTQTRGKVLGIQWIH